MVSITSKKISTVLSLFVFMFGLLILDGNQIAGAQGRFPPCPFTEEAVTWTNCQGQIKFPDGSTYSGDFKDGKRTGKGTKTWGPGPFEKDKYVGDFLDGRFNGTGTYFHGDGRKYIGEYRNDRRDGQGIFTWGPGPYEKDKYVGGYKDGKFDGQGSYFHGDGRKYVGQYKEGKRTGIATYTLANGEKYVGEFKDGFYSGTGKYYAANGTLKQSGTWLNGNFVSGHKLTANEKIVESKKETTQAVAAVPVQTAITTRRVALLIGNTNYQSQAPLTNPMNDTNLIASSLRDAGFQQVILKNDLTYNQMIQAIRDFAVISDSADWSVIYYSGHGIAFNGVNYMIPVDARLKADRDIDIEAVDIGKVSSAISGSKKLRVIILDMCRSNPFAKSMTRTIASRSVGRGLAPPTESEAGELTVFAAKDGQEALDGDGKNSPFAEALANRIKAPNIDVRRVFDRVRDDVLRVTNRKQQPFSYGSLPGDEDFYFIQN